MTDNLPKFDENLRFFPPILEAIRTFVYPCFCQLHNCFLRLQVLFLLFFRKIVPFCWRRKVPYENFHGKQAEDCQTQYPLSQGSPQLPVGDESLRRLVDPWIPRNDEWLQVKFIYSEKATKSLRNLYLFFDCISQKKVEISQNFVAFSEYMNFTSQSRPQLQL